MVPSLERAHFRPQDNTKAYRRNNLACIQGIVSYGSIPEGPFAEGDLYISDRCEQTGTPIRGAFQ